MTHVQPASAVDLGDFQTPVGLADEVCGLLVAQGVSPASVIEPSCGRGAFLRAARNAFPAAEAHGFEVNPDYVRQARLALPDDERVTVEAVDFFRADWSSRLTALPDPLLILGNPPWVTNSTIGAAGGTNLPSKSNVDGLRGMDAMTGRSNFDISECMIREYCGWLDGRHGSIAVLCKTSVARKVLAYAWTASLAVGRAKMHRIDAKRYFGAAVEACLLHMEFGKPAGEPACDVYDDLRSPTPVSRFGMADGRLVADRDVYECWRSLAAPNTATPTGATGWRSGIKHDCSRVFEFTAGDDGWVNGLGEHVAIESDVVFPLLKSSDLAHRKPPRKRVLVPHRTMSDSPEVLRRTAPQAWRYLQSHDALLSSRRSSIYKRRPPYSIFGIGEYAFAPWKVAISGLYKQLDFVMVGPLDGKPVLLDDTCYLFPCETEAECVALHALLTSEQAQEFYSAQVFWDAKRPITAGLLNRLDLKALAAFLECTDTASELGAERAPRVPQQNLFDTK